MEYFNLDGVDGDYFGCERYGTLSVAACARNFNEAPTILRSGRLHGCLGCPIGREHAGPAAAPPDIPQAAIIYRPVCVRCRRSGRSEDSRLVGRMRLVREQTICVSCYNREREVLAGANAKGAPPKKWSQLYRTKAAYVVPAGYRLEQLSTPVRDRAEAILTVLRRTPGPVSFAWVCPPRVIA